MPYIGILGKQFDRNEMIGICNSRISSNQKSFGGEKRFPYTSDAISFSQSSQKKPYTNQIAMIVIKDKNMAKGYFATILCKVTISFNIMFV
jgi:hypothetical protein